VPIHNKHLHVPLDHFRDPYGSGDEFEQHPHEFNQQVDEFNQQAPLHNQHLPIPLDHEADLKE
jgi:hypothetical protein